MAEIGTFKVSVDLTEVDNAIEKVKEQIKILNDNYLTLIVESEDGKIIAEITSEEAIPADGYVIRLIPKYD